MNSKADMTLLVMAGGQSRRMGKNKALLEIEDTSLISRVIEATSPLFKEQLIVTNTPHEYAHLQLPMTADIFPNKGALAGIYSGLKVSQNTYALVVACDMPFINPALVKHIISKVKGYDAVMPVINGRVEPFLSVYSKFCIPPIQECMEKDKKRIVSFLHEVKVYYLSEKEIAEFDPEHLSFFNINTPEDFELAKQIVKIKYRKSKDGH